MSALVRIGTRVPVNRLPGGIPHLPIDQPDPGPISGGGDQPDYPSDAEHPRGKMSLRISGKKNSRLIVPYAPNEVTYSGFGNEWVELARDGHRAPLLVKRGARLKKMSFNLFFGHRNWNKPVNKDLDKLIKLSQANAPIVVTFSSWESGLWRITNLTVTSMRRKNGNGEITRANVDVEFTRAKNADTKVGPASGGKGEDDDKKGGKGDKENKPPTHVSYYVVKAGDTLQSIAMRFYQNHKAWRKIAKVNGIKNPNKKLKVGTVLRLPS